MNNLQQLATGLTDLGRRMDAITGQLAALAHASPPLSSPAPAPEPPVTPMLAPREPYIPTPARYAGHLGTCSQFLHQCSLVFHQQPRTYATDQVKIAFIMSLLSDQASAWALAISTHSPELTQDYNQFTQEMKKVFDHPVKGKEAVSNMLRLRQGTQSASQYALEFRILAAESGWNDTALQGIFLKGISEELKDELVTRDEPDSLEALIDLTIRLDNRIRERRREKSQGQRPRSFSSATATQVAFFPSTIAPPSTSPTADIGPPAPTTEEPMQLGRSKFVSRGETAALDEPALYLLWPKGALSSTVSRRAKRTGSSAGRRTLVSQTSTVSSTKRIRLPGMIHWTKHTLRLMF